MKEGWEYKKLGDCCKVIMGQSPDGSSFNDHDGIEFHQGKTYFGDRWLNHSYTYTDSPTKIAETNSVLLCVRAPVGFPNITNRQICIGRGLCSVFPNGCLNIIYLYYTLLRKQDYFEKNATGSTFKAISSKVVNDTPIDLPPLSVQQSIVAELDKINELIRLKKEQLKDLDALAQSMFYDMFGDPVENEKGWEVKKLGELIKVIGGYAFKSTDFIKEGIPVLRIGNINTGEFKPINLVFWCKDEKLSRYRIKPGDLVISLTGTVGKSDYGNICILDNSYEEYYLNQRNAKLEIFGDINKLYLSQILKIESIKGQLTNVNRGVRQANIANKDIENLQIPLPPLTLQQSFAKRIESIEKQKEQVTKAIKDLETLLASRMQYWFD